MRPLCVLWVLLAIATGGCTEDEEAAEREHPDAARESLRAANKRTVRAIQDVRAFVQVGDDRALGRARARLSAARQRLAAAADEPSGAAPEVIAP